MTEKLFLDIDILYSEGSENCIGLKIFVRW